MDSLSSTYEAPGRGPDLTNVVVGEVAGVEPKAGHFPQQIRQKRSSLLWNVLSSTAPSGLADRLEYVPILMKKISFLHEPSFFDLTMLDTCYRIQHDPELVVITEFHLKAGAWEEAEKQGLEKGLRRWMKETPRFDSWFEGI